MFTKTFLTTRVTFIHAVAILALGASLFMFQVPFTQAASASMSNGSVSIPKTLTTAELQALIAQLQNQVRELNASIASASSQFSAGMSVEITDTLRVRNSASIDGQIIGTQRSGAKGVVVEGPINQGGHTWVKVDYETGPDGWNAAGWLKNRTSPEKPVTGTFTAIVSDLKATVSFTLSNGCGGYVISWGDGTKTELAGASTGRPCTMAIVNVSKDHTYAKAGTYTVKVERFNGTTRRDVSEKAIKVGTDTPTAINCYVGLESYKEGTKRTSILNANGSQSVITDGYYVCRGGKWVIEGSLPKPNLPSATSTIAHCLSGAVKYPEGTKLQTVTENGQTRTIADASFVCRGGKWVVEGSLPKPATSTPAVVVCLSGFTKYSEGAKLQSITENGVTRRISDGSFVCRSGKWVVEGSLPTSMVRGASTDIMTEIGITLSTIRSIIAEIR